MMHDDEVLPLLDLGLSPPDSVRPPRPSNPRNIFHFATGLRSEVLYALPSDPE